MLINRIELEEKLNTKISAILNDKSVSKEFTDKITDILSSKGISPAETNLILDKKITVETMDIIFLGVLCKALYQATSEIIGLKHLSKQFVIEEMFTKTEINGINGFVKRVDTASDFVKFEDVIQLEDNKWITKISNKQIKKLFDDNKLGYDPEQQRELILRKVGSTYVGRIDIDKSQLTKIKNLMLDNNYHVNTITFNMSYGADYEYDEKNKILHVPGIIYVPDGWTRCNATLEATNVDNTLEFNQPVMIMALSPEDAAYAAYQFNEQRKFRIGTESIKSLEPASLLVRDIQKKKSLLEGVIGNNKQENKMFIFNDFVTIIESIYDSNELKNNFSRLEITKSIISGFENLIYDGILDPKKSYTDVELAYYSICVKIANEKNIDLIQLINKYSIEHIITSTKSRGLKPKIKQIEELIKDE